METCAAAGLHLPAGSCELSLLSRADGSASCSRGDTTVLAAVYGPAEVKHSREISDKATVEVILKGKCGFPGVIEKSQEHMIRGVVEGTVLTGLHPRTSITLVLQVIQDSGSLLACCMNATSLALIDAGLPMRWFFCGIACALYADGSISLEPVTSQEMESQALMTFVLDSKDKRILASHTKGSFLSSELQKCIAVSQTAADKLFEIYKHAITRRYSKTSLEASAPNLWST
uniref:exosome complex component RRP46 isoform X1 n=1 Tax=Myxine glutinosa TaxID=7769 RepID=UPI00358F303C